MSASICSSVIVFLSPRRDVTISMTRTEFLTDSTPLSFMACCGLADLTDFEVETLDPCASGTLFIVGHLLKELPL